MNVRKYARVLIWSILVAGGVMHSQVQAQEDLGLQPTFTSPDLASQAVQKAEQAARSGLPSLQSALQRIDNADRQLKQSQLSGDRKQVNMWRKALKKAEDSFATILSKMTGVPGADINRMHMAGVHWADIAGEFGVIGVSGRISGPGKDDNGEMRAGHMMTSRRLEILYATKRNKVYGRMQGHETGLMNRHRFGKGFMMTPGGPPSKGSVINSAGPDTRKGGSMGGGGNGGM